MRRSRVPAGTAWARRRGSASALPKRDWVPIATLIVATLPGVAALIAIYFSNQSSNNTLKATNRQLEIANHQVQIAQQGQITDRYNAAVTNPGSRSIEVRLGGIYALQRLMQDSPRDQPTVIAVLCAFDRDQSSATVNPGRPSSPLPTDIQAAVTVVGSRTTARDGRTTVVDFDGAQLAHAQMGGLRFPRGDFVLAHLSGAILSGADLTAAFFSYEFLTGTDLTGANLTNANLFRANLTGADLSIAFLTGAALIRTDLTGARLSGTDFTGANLTGAHLTGARLRGTDLTGADLIQANLSGANLTRANLTGAKWWKYAPAPDGWVRDPRSGRLKRASA